MAEKILIQEKWSYSADEYYNWTSGDSFIVNSILPVHLRDFFLSKHDERPNRFFGEAIVLREMNRHCNGHLWYNSFQWLTSDKWSSLTGISKNIEKVFLQHFYETIKEKNVSQIRAAAKQFMIKHPAIEPKVPDVSLLNKNNQLQFIEVKLPVKPDSKRKKKLDDDIHSGQLEGLALLKKYIYCRVGIIWLYPEGMSFELPDYEERFMEIYNGLDDVIN